MIRALLVLVPMLAALVPAARAHDAPAVVGIATVAPEILDPEFLAVLDHAPGASPALFWSGGIEFASAPLDLQGGWTLVLGAWCHGGVDRVRAWLEDEHGAVVAEVFVDGQGVARRSFALPAGRYVVAVASRSMPEYFWSLALEPGARR